MSSTDSAVQQAVPDSFARRRPLTTFLALVFGIGWPMLVFVLGLFGVAIGCANIIALIAVPDTAQHQTFAILREVGANRICVLPFAEAP